MTNRLEQVQNLPQDEVAAGQTEEDGLNDNEATKFRLEHGLFPVTSVESNADPTSPTDSTIYDGLSSSENKSEMEAEYSTLSAGLVDYCLVLGT